MFLKNSRLARLSTFCIRFQNYPFQILSGSKGLYRYDGTGFIGGGVAGAAPISLYHQYLQYKSLLSCDSNPTCSKNGIGGEILRLFFFTR